LNDNDVKGLGNQIDYGDRIEDSRIGRFLSVDPLQKKFPELTPYQFASNSPIANVDLDGKEAYWYKIYFDHTTNKWTSKLETVKNNLFLSILPGYQLVVKIGDSKWYNIGGYSKSEMQAKVNELVADPAKGMRGILEEEAYMDAYSAKNKQEWRDIWVQGFAVGMMAKGFSIESSPQANTSQQAAAANNGGSQMSSTVSVQEQTVASTTEGQVIGSTTEALIEETIISQGAEELAAIKSKVQNAFNGIDKTHLDAAIGDLAGKPIVKYGKVWDHLDDITSHLRGLNGQIKRLDKMINSDTFSGRVLEEAKELRSSLQKTYDYYYGALQRASNKYKKNINVKKG
jgi:RHS repeat-associated protein